MSKGQVVYLSERGSALRVVHLFDRAVWFYPRPRLKKHKQFARWMLYGLCSAESRDLVSANPVFVTCKRCINKQAKKEKKS